MKDKIDNFFRLIFFIFLRIIILVVIGLNVRRRELLPSAGPAIIVANHNSHLDTLVLINLFNLPYLHKIHPVAAADYFLRNKFLAWFSTKIIGIIPIARGKASREYDPLKGCCDALDAGNIIIIFPEGTRGEPEKIESFKKGVAYLVERRPHIPVIPVFMHGLGKVLPKGDFIPVPFFCDIFVGNPIYFGNDKKNFMEALNNRFTDLANEKSFAPWE